MEAGSLLLGVRQVKLGTRPYVIYMPLTVVAPRYAWLKALLEMRLQLLDRTAYKLQLSYYWL